MVDWLDGVSSNSDDLKSKISPTMVDWLNSVSSHSNDLKSKNFSYHGGLIR